MTEADETLSRLLREPVAAPRDEAFADRVMAQARPRFWTLVVWGAVHNLAVLAVGAATVAGAAQAFGYGLAHAPGGALAPTAFALVVVVVALAGPSALRWIGGRG